MNWGQLRCFALFFLGELVFLGACSPAFQIGQSEGHYLALNEIKADSLVEEFLKPYSDSVSKSMGQVVGHASVALPKIKGTHETALGNFMSDLLLERAQKMNPKVKASLLNLGGIRASLPNGPITLGDVFSLMPFDNKIVLIQLGPNEAKEMFEYIGKHPGTPFSGFTLRCEGEKWLAAFNGTNPGEGDSLMVATSDFLAQGGDKMNFFLTCPLKSDPGVLLREAIVEYLKEMTQEAKQVNSQLDGRIQPCSEQ